MKKEILIAILCASLMLITPFTVVARENKIISNLTEEPDIEDLVAQLRVVIDEILQKYGHIIKVANLCGVILNTLSLIENIIICILLIIIAIPILLLFFILLRLDMYGYFLYSLGLIILMFTEISSSNCNPLNWFSLKLPFQTLYTLSEPQDINNLIEDCPCLEE